MGAPGARTVVGGVAWLAAKKLFHEIVVQTRAAGTGYQLRPINADEARTRARRVVGSRSNRDPDGLVVVEEAEDRVYCAWSVADQG